MKALLLLAALLSAPAFAYNDVAIEDARETLEYAISSLAEGTATNADVWDATLFVLEMEFAAGKLPKEQFCKAALEARSKLTQVISAEVSAGQSSIQDLVEAQREYYALAELCN